MLLRRLYRGFWAAVGAGVVVMGLTVPAAAARAPSSVLIYTCGPGFANLCQINADGRGFKRLTTDGSATVYPKKYNSPSLSRDGRKLAYLRGYNLYVLDRATGRRTRSISNKAQIARISPDGTKVGDIELYPSVLLTLGWVPTACMFNTNLTGHDSGRNCRGSAGSFGFTNDNRILGSVSAQYDGPNNRYDKGICLFTATGSSGCARTVVGDLGYDLWDPAMSPNGKWLAVTRSLPGKTTGAIAVYNYATGKLVRVLTAGTGDESPVWSPDGSRIAFERNASKPSARIYTVSVNGGAARSLTNGGAVTWGR